ncbi:LOW QUALITY PROTEIN: ECF subfamily RNA polymerase sigma factor, partial [Streptomyces sp. SPB78]
MTDRTAEFERWRPLLLSVAYRILGGVAEAEDAVQETWLRYEAAEAEPRAPRAYLAAVVTRVAIDVLRSARVRRETYVGPWLPEPLLADPYEDPERTAELADSVSMAALLLLERLSPLERAVFVLREVFDFGYAEVAGAVGRSEDAKRQLAARARRHMREGRPRFAADRAEREELAARFFDALREGEMDGQKHAPRRRRDGGGRRGRQDPATGPYGRGPRQGRPPPHRRLPAHGPRGHHVRAAPGQRAAGRGLPGPHRQDPPDARPGHRGGQRPDDPPRPQPGQAPAPGAGGGRVGGVGGGEAGAV